MSYHHLNITQLTNIESNYYLGVNARECARRMKIGKDKVYRYYRLLKQGLTVEEIYSTYKQNKHRCGRKERVLSEQKLKNIHELLEQGWSLDAIAGRDKLMGHSETVSTKTLYKLVKGGIIDAKKLRRKGKNILKITKKPEEESMIVKPFMSEISSILKIRRIQNMGTLRGIHSLPVEDSHDLSLHGVGDPLSVRIVSQRLSP